MSESKHETKTSKPAFSDVETLRKRARKNVEDGAVTDVYAADRKEVIKRLNEALATELTCVLRYRRHYYMAEGMSSDAVKEEFKEHAEEEQEHADKIASRIVQLGGAPDMNPATFAARSHSEYVEGNSLADMVKENLIAERIAIESYNEIINYLEGKDPTSHKLMREILAKEEEHAEDMASLLKRQ
jgi:bacterioferritin